MSKQSKHERIIREELEAARVDLEKSEEVLRVHQAISDSVRSRITTLERVLERAAAGGDDAES